VARLAAEAAPSYTSTVMCYVIVVIAFETLCDMAVLRVELVGPNKPYIYEGVSLLRLGDADV
jgi:hypothetical protein